MTAAAPSTTTTKVTTKVTTKTLYHVLREVTREGGATYEPVAANVHASSPGHAIRQAAKDTGVYVAIPSRSFAPTKVTVSQETVITLG